MRCLAVVGNVNVDLILGPAEPWPQPGTEVLLDHSELRLGGAAGNVSLAWMGLGVPHRIAANVGADAFGDWLKAGFDDLSRDWPVEPGPTTVSVGITHPSGERTFFTGRGHIGALCLTDTLRMLDGMQDGILLVCGSFMTDALAADYAGLFDWAAARGIEIALDTGWPITGWTAPVAAQTRGWAARSHHLLLNEIELLTLTGETTPRAAAEAMAALMPPGATVAVKLGPAGVGALTAQGDWICCPAPHVAVIDTIGAGDVFNAGYLAALAAGRPLPQALEAGVAAASAAISTYPRSYGGRA